MFLSLNILVGHVLCSTCCQGLISFILNVYRVVVDLPHTFWDFIFIFFVSFWPTISTRGSLTPPPSEASASDSSASPTIILSVCWLHYQAMVCLAYTGLLLKSFVLLPICFWLRHGVSVWWRRSWLFCTLRFICKAALQVYACRTQFVCNKFFPLRFWWWFLLFGFWHEILNFLKVSLRRRYGEERSSL